MVFARTIDYCNLGWKTNPIVILCILPSLMSSYALVNIE